MTQINKQTGKIYGHNNNKIFIYEGLTVTDLEV